MRRYNNFIWHKRTKYRRRAEHLIDDHKIKDFKKSYEVLKHNYMMMCLDLSSLERKIRKLEEVINIYRMKSGTINTKLVYNSLKELRSKNAPNRFKRR